MTKCYFCENEPVENWFGTYCTNCRKIKNLGNVYGFARIYNILENCCIRNPDQLESKILKQKKEIKLDTNDKKLLKDVIKSGIKIEK
tara:strand:- start:452 stop:712 length:261 start_codon:yes stop_codon:yes gene_type:complete